MERLVKVDRNGTKYFEDDVCPKCGGAGYIDAYDYVEGGICFMCNGSGKHLHKWVERTPEYEAKLEAKRQAKQAAKNPDTFKGFGCAEDGSFYAVLGDTYGIKDELKAAGAKYNRIMGWHFAEENAEFAGIMLDVGYAFDFSSYGVAYLKDEPDMVNAAKAAAAPKPERESEYVGEVGDKLSIELTLKKVAGYDTQYGWTSVYTFEDEDGNLFVWKTGASIDASRGSKVTVKGTVKEHREYRNERQTVLTRCKVA